MLEKMGSQHSSLSCGQLAYNFHNCFGMGSASPRSAGSDDSTVLPRSIGGNLSVNGKQETHVVQVRQGKSRSHRLSCTDTCCAQNCSNNQDQFPYDLCDVSEDRDLCDVSQDEVQTKCLREASNGVTTNRGVCVCKKNSLKCSCTKYQDNVIPPKVPTASNFVTCLSANRSVESSNNNKSLTDMATEQPGPKEKLLSTSNTTDVVQSDHISNQLLVSSNPNQNVVSNVDDGTSADNPEGTTYFRKLVADEELKLTGLIKAWSCVIANGSHCPSEVCDEIRSVVGQTRLIIDERFVQFSALVDRADGKTDSDRPVLVSDLQGFWDMIYFQVEDVVKKFENLQILKESNWIANVASKNGPLSTNKRATKVQSSRPKKTKAQSKSKEEDKKRREAARKRLAEARKALASRAQSDSPANEPTLDNAVTPLPEQLAHGQSVSTTSEALSEPLSLSSKFDAVSCSLSVVPAKQESNIANAASTSTSLVH